MSVESMALALHHSRATGLARLVLIGICNHDGDGGAYPTVATLAKYAGGVTDRTVRRALAELVDLGEIVVHVNQGGSRDTPADRRPNLYEVKLACPPECDGSKNHRLRTSGSSQGGGTQVSARQNGHGRTPETARGDARVRHGGTHVSAKPSIEPSMKGGEVPALGHQGGTPASPPLENSEKQQPPIVYARPDRCRTHQGDEAPPPCGGCKDARQAHEARTARESHLAAQNVAQQAAQRRAAPKCGAHNWRTAGTCPDCAGEHKGGLHDIPSRHCHLCDRTVWGDDE